MSGERIGQTPHIRHSEVEALGSGRRDDVRGVAGQEKPAVAHRFGDEAPHRRHRLLRDRADVRRPPIPRGQPRLELVPDAIVGPVVDVLVRRTLQIQARHRRRAHAEERKAAFVQAVDQFLGRWCGVGQDTEPRERILPLVDAQLRGGNRRTADAVEAVAAGDEVARDLVRRAVDRARDARCRTGEVVHLHVGHLEMERPARGHTRRDQVLHDLVLAVDGDGPAAGQRRHVDVMPQSVEGDGDARVPQTFAAKPVADADLVHEIHRALLEHAGTDARDDVFLAAILEDDRVDALQVQQVTEHQTGRSGPDDGHLGAEASHHRQLYRENAMRHFAFADGRLTPLPDSALFDRPGDVRKWRAE